MPQRAFAPIYPNPYIAGNPIRDEKMFFGREDEFRFVARALEDGRKTALIILFGERRSGKSSILYQILNGRLGQQFLPIFVDMQILADIAGDAEFFTRIIADAGKQLDGNGLFSGRYVTQAHEATATSVFREFLQELKTRFPGRAPLLLIDEYEILEAKITEGSLSRHILTFFAGLLETDLVSFVFTGSKNLEARDRTLWGEELFRKSISRKISFLTKDDTARLVTQPLHNRITFAAEVITQIYTLTAGQPFYTQMICQNLVYHLNEVQKENVANEDLQAVVSDIMENPPPQLLFNWSEHSPKRKLALSLLAEFSQTVEAFLSAHELCHRIALAKLGLELDAEFFNSELSSLTQDEYVVMAEDRSYSFRLDLYRRWVRHDHNVWQVKKEIGPVELARITARVHGEKENRKKILRILERSFAIGLAVLASYALYKFFLEKHRRVIIQANGGPIMVIVDGDTVGSSRGQADSTRFVIPRKLIKGAIYDFEIILDDSSDRVRVDSVVIEKDDQEVLADFPLYPVTVVTDAASLEMQLGGERIRTREDQPEAWRHTFQVCAGKYMLRAKDRRTGEVKDSVLSVPVASNQVRVDFDSVVVLKLTANLYPFEYRYEWRDARGRRQSSKAKRADSVVVLRGQLKGVNDFIFTSLGKKQERTLRASITKDTTITITFVPPPDTEPRRPDRYTLHVESDPTGANAFLNDVFWRSTPCDTTLVAGSYSLTLTSSGYEPVTRSMKLNNNTTINISLPPEPPEPPKFGVVKCIVQDEQGKLLSDVQIFVDSLYKGDSHRIKEIRLPAIEHKFLFKRGQYHDKDTIYTVAEDTTTILHVKLVKKP